MQRRPFLAVAVGSLVGLSGCSARSIRDRTTEETVEGEDEGSLQFPTDEPIDDAVIGASTDDTDPHVVAVRNAVDTRSLEIRVLAGEYGDTVHAERYSLAAGEHVRLELREPDEYALELYVDDDVVGDPYEIEADWFEYDCPATVLELREGDRLSGSTTPDTDVC